MYLVTGGKFNDNLVSTEILVSGTTAWKKVGEIPLKTVRPMIFRTIWIEDPENGLQNIFNSADQKKVHAAIEKFLVKYVNKLLDK